MKSYVKTSGPLNWFLLINAFCVLFAFSNTVYNLSVDIPDGIREQRCCNDDHKIVNATCYRDNDVRYRPGKRPFYVNMILAQRWLFVAIPILAAVARHDLHHIRNPTTWYTLVLYFILVAINIAVILAGINDKCTNPSKTSIENVMDELPYDFTETVLAIGFTVGFVVVIVIYGIVKYAIIGAWIDDKKNKAIYHA
jgi:hypothetical protein